LKILGIHPFGHDSSIVFLDTRKKSIQTFTLERFTRKKHDMRFVLPYFLNEIENFSPKNFALSHSEGRVMDIYIFKSLQLIYELQSKKRKAKLNLRNFINLLTNKCFIRILLFFRRFQTLSGFKIFLEKLLRTKEITFYDHHDCHAYSALMTSSFLKQDNVLIVTVDGQGDDLCASISIYKSGIVKREVSVPNMYSICLLYSYFTEVAGFNPNADEGKLEALACYFNGKDPLLLKAMREWIDIDLNTLNFIIRPNSKIPFDSIPKNRKKIISWLRRSYFDIGPEAFAYTIQTLFEEKYLNWIKVAKYKFNSNYICLAGGGIANVKLNLRVFEECNFKGLHVIPSMGDDGVALGAAIIEAVNNNEKIDFIANNKMPFWGFCPTSNDIKKAINLAIKNGLNVEGPFSDDSLTSFVAEFVSQNKICAIYRGNAEFGPRALGHRSIIANPTDNLIRDSINKKFKKREWFQPFCPIFIESEAKRILIDYYPNKHMTCAFRVKKGFIEKLPAVVHVDGTARAEIITRDDEPFIYDVISQLKKKIGFGVLLNTSFNLHGRSMVNTPEDAIIDFGDCGLDYLVMDKFILSRKS
jgi:carbamoyltransferase